MQHMYYWGTVGGPSPRGLDAIAWASAGGGAARILAVPPGGRRAPLRGAGSSPGRGVRPCRGGGAARPWCPPVVARWSPRTRPLLCLWGMGGTWSSPVGSGVASSRAPRRPPGARSLSGVASPGRSRRTSSAMARSSRWRRRRRQRDAEAARGRWGEEAAAAGRGRVWCFLFYFTRGNRGSNAERDSNAGRGPRRYAAAGTKGYALKRGSLEAEPFDRVEVR
jgi:hypothetical protein